MTVTNKIIIDKSRCVICWSNKSRFLGQKPNKKPKKSDWKNTNPKLLVY